MQVFKVLARLCDLSAKYPQQRLAITRAAVDALEDKTSSVRKNAISLLERLILTHPYGMYGGLLSETEWKEKYKEASDTLEKMEARLGRRPRSTRRTKRKRKGVKGDHDEECEGEEDGQAGVAKTKKRGKPYVS